MRHLMFSLTVLLLITALAATSADDLSEPIPSYQQALEAYRAGRDKAGGPALSAEDRRVMERAAKALASAMPDPGLRVGERAPEFVLPNAFGEPVRLSGLLSVGPVVLTFYRGAWCPYCNLQLRGLQQTLPFIEQQGAQLVAITPQKPDKSLGQVEKDGYSFEILSDLDDRVMKAYRLYFEVPPDLSEVYKHRLSLDLAEYNGEGRYVLPVPATFVIDRDGVVRAAFADVDYRQRVEPAAVVAALQTLRAE